MEPIAKVACLRRAKAYPNPTSGVEVVETHISWVFLTDRFAYKLNKPVRYPYLDFRTMDARHQDCRAEVRLNRRLAGDVYLGVVPLVERDGCCGPGGDGKVIDWLVQMRRLPSTRMLDVMISNGQATTDDMQRVGARLGRFYRHEPSIETDVGEYRSGLADDIGENRRELSDPAFGLPRAFIEGLCLKQLRFLQTHHSLLDERVDVGCIVEGHGDLRPEHVCLLEEPVVIDCLEFKRAFRLVDPADELGYLALECERLGAPWAGDRLFAAYGEVTGDRPAPALVHFYQSFRATLRAKIAIWHNRDDGIRQPEKWIRRALEYLEVAQRHADQLMEQD